jgi:hypothetical protein
MSVTLNDRAPSPQTANTLPPTLKTSEPPHWTTWLVAGSANAAA